MHVVQCLVWPHKFEPASRVAGPLQELWAPIKGHTDSEHSRAVWSTNVDIFLFMGVKL